MSRSGTSPKVRVVAAALAVGALGMTIGGCSQIYLDRRDSLALSAGDAIAANQAVQVIDPWPRRSGNTNLVFSGQRMQAAAERYRTNTVVQPVDPMAPQLAVPAAPTSSNGNGTSSGTGAPNTTLVIGAPAAATAATP
ncbi:MAG TPA: hypothetical protein VFA80_04905 [Xanthobacteraceae bacterium]|jgi:hypothetical protein|nr:hypothetical protein [Xanthobacteraceae bacterium]